MRSLKTIIFSCDKGLFNNNFSFVIHRRKWIYYTIVNKVKNSLHLIIGILLSKVHLNSLLNNYMVFYNRPHIYQDNT